MASARMTMIVEDYNLEKGPYEIFTMKIHF